jgi:Asp/Glu/hydantoin racemase
MKIGIVYTSTTPELIQLVEQEVRLRLPSDAQLISYQDPSILKECIDTKKVTATAASRLAAMYCKAINDGADVILNCCSSVGEVADVMQDFAKFVGIPIVRIDELMCRYAVLQGKHIGVMATLSSTLNPTKNTLIRVAREAGRNIVLHDGLIEGAFGLDQAQFQQVMIQKARELQPDVDVILFAQGSMAYCERVVHEATKKPVVSSPRFGAIAVQEALIMKGLLERNKQ